MSYSRIQAEVVGTDNVQSWPVLPNVAEDLLRASDDDFPIVIEFGWRAIGRYTMGGVTVFIIENYLED